MSVDEARIVNDTDANVIPAIAMRWSPYRFDQRPVEDDHLTTCLEAAKWAASSYNEQPWSFIVARRQDTTAFETMLECLMEANRAWASRAGALLFTVIRTTFESNQKPNRVALHDLGQAAAHFALQATQLGLQVHQMAGVQLEQIRTHYNIPDGYEPETAIAIGYPDMTAPTTPEDQELEDRQSGPRKRRPLSELVFSDNFGQPATWLK